MRIIIKVVRFFACLPETDLPPDIHIRLELVPMFAHPFLQAHGVADAIAVFFEKVFRITVHAAAVTWDGKCPEALHADAGLAQLPWIRAEMFIFVSLVLHVCLICVADEDMLLLRTLELHRHLLDAVFRVVSGLPDRPQAFVDRQLCARQHAIPRRQRDDFIIDGIFTPEIIPEKGSQALVRHRVATHRLQLSLHLRDGFRIRLVAERHLLELRALELEVALVREENAFGRKSVTPRVDELLIVALKAFRHRVVQHETHIRPVELEKRIRRHDEDPGTGMGLGIVCGRPLYTPVGRRSAGAECTGIRHAFLAGQTCVVGQCRETAAIEQLRDVLRQPMLGAVDDACLIFVAAQKIEKKWCLALRAMHG